VRIFSGSTVPTPSQSRRTFFANAAESEPFRHYQHKDNSIPKRWLRTA
jgi:hypothetical protein